MWKWRGSQRGRRLADENSHAGKAPAADSVAENKK